MDFCENGLYFVHVWQENHNVSGITVSQSTFGSGINFL
jgi:hypothetical protein